MGRLLTKLIKYAAIAAVLTLVVTSTGLWFFGQRIVMLLKPSIEALASESTGFQVSFDSGYVRLLPRISIVLHNGTATPLNGCAPWNIERAALQVRLLPLIKGRVDIRTVELAGARGAIGMHNGEPSLTSPTGEPCRLNDLSHPQSPPSTRKSSRSADSFADRLELDIDNFTVSDTHLAIFGLEEEHSLELSHLHAELVDDRGSLFIPQVSISGAFDELPISLELNKVSAKAGGTSYAAASGILHLGNQRIETSGEYDIATATGRLLLSLHGVSIGEDEKLFSDLVTPVSGTIDASLNATISGDDITIAGTTTFRDLQTHRSDSLKVKELTTKDVSIKIHDGTLEETKAHLALADFHCTDDGDTYSVERAEGDLTLTHQPRIAFSGFFDIRNFGFKDIDTTITKASAKLESISGGVSPQGDVDVSLHLNAQSIYLTNPNVIVNSVTSVQAPLKITVPAHGGYSVLGPVSIAGGVLTLAGKRLEKTGGLIEMLVSSPLKDFRSKNLSTSAYGEQITGRTHFAMTHTDYQIMDTAFTIGGGTFSPQLSLSRVNMHAFSASAQAQDLPLVPTYRALMQEDPSPLRGTLTTFSARLAGNRANLTESLTGDGSLLISNGVVQRIDIEALVRSAIEAIPVVGPKLLVSPPPGQIQDGSISASVNIGSSKVSTQDLKVQFSNMTVEAALGVGFDSSLNGTAKVIFLEESFRLFGFGWDGLGNFLAREGRVAIPLVVGRTVSNPSVDPDMKEIGKFISGIDLVESVTEGVRSIGGGQ